MITDQQYLDWLSDQSAIRCILVEADVGLNGGGSTTRYLSDKGYVTGASDTPANTVYEPVVVGGLKFSEALSIEGGVSLSFGDVEINNITGAYDSWLDDYWNNRSVKIFIGDVTWPRSDFRQIFGGVSVGLDTRRRDRLNLQLGDKLQRLNSPVSEAKLGGSTPNADQLRPLCFGECHNVEPLLIDAATHEYEVHQGQIENIIEVRDNGVPVQFTPLLSIGRFRLVNNPVGQITCSVQGHAPTSNLALQSQTFMAAAWAANAVTKSTSAVLSPDGVTTGFSIAEDTSTGTHYVSQNNIAMVNGQTYTFSIFLRAGARNKAMVRYLASGPIVTTSYVIVNLTTGVIEGSSGPLVGSSISPVGNSWYRVSISAVAQSSANATVAVMLYTTANTYTGDGASGLYMWGAQVEQGLMPGAYRVTTASPEKVYPNTVAMLVQELVTKYGTASTRFAVADLDLSNLQTFDWANRQAVGIYLKDRSNVLEVCSKLTDSLGTRVSMTKTGLLNLVKLTLPQATAGTTVTSVDMADRALFISSQPAVVASVKLGYCRNWTVQDALPTGIVEEHKALYSEEWLTSTKSDSTTATNYNLFTDPALQETLLLATTDADAEATRRLNLWKVRRKVFRYKGYMNLLTEKLGSPQTIQHSRFGLASGVTGQIISIATDWIGQRVEIEVLI